MSIAQNPKPEDHTNNISPEWKIQPLAWHLVLSLAGIKLLAHLLTSGSYGYFRDELYFLDCARHWQWGYVDDTPLIALYAKIALLLGGSLPAVRLLPALAGAGTVALGSLLARELGGGRFAQTLAGICVLAAPVYLGMHSILCVGAFEPLFWMGCVLFTIRIARTGNSRLWLWVGLFAGLGIENKYAMLLFLAALLAGLILTPLRRELRTPWLWGGAGLAVLIFLPTLVWQIRNDFPLLEDQANIRRLGKNVVLSPLNFITQQFELLNWLLLPVWLTGLFSLLLRRGPKLRVLGWLYLMLLAAMIALHAKNYYLAAVYPMLFSAGAVAFEAGLAKWTWSRNRIWPKACALTAGFVSFALLVPALLPVLPPAQLLAYQAFLGIKSHKLEVRHEAPLDQRFSDQFGWPEMVAKIARIFTALPPEEGLRTVIFTANYGEAGAVNQFGPALGLPPAICAHQANSFWGPPSLEPVAAICVGYSRAVLETLFHSVEQVGVHYHPWGMAYENQPIYLGRGFRTPLSELWPKLKYWD